jgi:hypothetical protein
MNARHFSLKICIILILLAVFKKETDTAYSKLQQQHAVMKMPVKQLKCLLSDFSLQRHAIHLLEGEGEAKGRLQHEQYIVKYIMLVLPVCITILNRKLCKSYFKLTLLRGKWKQRRDCSVTQCESQLHE